MRSGGASEQAGNKGGLRPHVPTADVMNLPLSDHRHRLVPSQCRPGCLHAAKAKPWPDQPFDAAMVLFDDVVQAVALPQPREAPQLVLRSAAAFRRDLRRRARARRRSGGMAHLVAGPVGSVGKCPIMDRPTDAPGRAGRAL